MTDLGPQVALVARSAYFDADWYIARYHDVALSGILPAEHFIRFGAILRRDPGPNFDTSFYLESNPDVAASQLNPLVHYLRYGRAEGRLPTARGQPSACGPATPRTSRSAPRVVVYTVVAGGYDVLRDPEPSPSLEYVVFSDSGLESEIWRPAPLNYFDREPARAARFVKLHPHVYFSDYDVSIWLDANIQLRDDAAGLLAQLGPSDYIGLFPHPHRSCAYIEAAECMRREKDTADILVAQAARYRKLGLPYDHGLWETGVIVRLHNDPRCIQLMATWWNEIFLGSKRDQVSLPFALSLTTGTVAPLGPPGSDLRVHSSLAYSKHTPATTLSPTKNANTTASATTYHAPQQGHPAADIGVCVFNSPKETMACLRSVIAARRPDDQLIIVDDASSRETREMLWHFAQQHDRVELITHDTNLGYTRSANDVLRISTKPYVVLLNSDTVVGRGTFAKLVDCGERYARLGIIGPVSNAAGWQTVPTLLDDAGQFFNNPLPAGFSVDAVEDLCGAASSGIVPFVPLVNGFCFALKRPVIETVGEFDTVAFPAGYGEEDDYCLRAGNEGFVCGVATNAYVYHVKSASFTPARRVVLAREGGKALRKKHSPERVSLSVNVTQNHPELAEFRRRLSTSIRRAIERREPSSGEGTGF